MISLAFRMLVAMTVVIGLMYVAARVMRNRMGPAARSIRHGDQRLIAIVDRQTLARNTSIVVAQVGAQTLILGVTENQVTNLGELGISDLEDGLDVDWTTHSGNDASTDGDDPTVGQDNHSDKTWKSMLEQLRGMSATTADE